LNLKVGNVIRFKGSDDLYKIIYQEETGELLARFCWDDARCSIEPGRLSVIVNENDVSEIVYKSTFDVG